MIIKPIVNTSNVEEQLRRLTTTLSSTIDGKLQNTGQVTLTDLVTSTVETNVLVSPDSKVFFTPTTANAAGEIATMYYAAGDQQFTITHANAASTDRTFDYMVIG